MCSNLEDVNDNLKAFGALPQDDVDQRSDAHAPIKSDHVPKKSDDEIPPKKRKTRRGRNKRRHPYLKIDRKSWNATKPEAPHNSNQFLIEDHGTTKEIDDCLRNDKMARTRDSSFSMDSDGEFYSSPDDEEAFLRKDFDDTYENLRTERFNTMTKNDIIQEFLQLEKKYDTLTKSQENCTENEHDIQNNVDFQREIERLLLENESLKRENKDLRNKISLWNSDSEDTESDSSETCSSCSSSGNESVKEVPISDEIIPDYSQMNGHSPSNLQPV
ncbi:hypothetical protein RN001_000670 [Aquatica leii]|uniref:Uncharacterized protein n=1 Tax=Aquatica leii TaxID=1421715 RepID=A0AAN7SKR2_9COLE|nr:hypothetical protein RN001_000670 [Aquatica leii]